MFQQILFWKITIQRGTSSNHFTFLQQSKTLQIMLLNIRKIATDKSIRHQNEDYVMSIFHIRTNKSCSGSRLSHLTKTPGHQISSAAASGGSRGVIAATTVVRKTPKQADNKTFVLYLSVQILLTRINMSSTNSF